MEPFLLEWINNPKVQQTIIKSFLSLCVKFLSASYLRNTELHRSPACFIRVVIEDLGVWFPSYMMPHVVVIPVKTDLVVYGITLLQSQSNDPVDDFLWDTTEAEGGAINTSDSRSFSYQNLYDQFTYLMFLRIDYGIFTDFPLSKLLPISK